MLLPQKAEFGKSIVAKCNVYKEFTTLVAANLTARVQKIISRETLFSLLAADYNNLPDKLERTAFQWRLGWRGMVIVLAVGFYMCAILFCSI